MIKRNDCSQGFSLVELIIVIAVMSILGAISSYSWKQYVDNSSLRAAGRDVAAEISLYRQKSIGESKTYTMTFDISGNRYIVSNDPGSTADDIIKSFAAFGSGIRVVSTTFSGNAFDMQPRGLLDGSGTINLTNARGSTSTVTVNQAGRTHVEFTMR